MATPAIINSRPTNTTAVKVTPSVTFGNTMAAVPHAAKSTPNTRSNHQCERRCRNSCLTISWSGVEPDTTSMLMTMSSL